MDDTLNTIPELILALQKGCSIIMVDAPERENEGDLIMAAQMVTPDAINFMITHGRGLVCMPLTPQHADQLHLPLMVSDNQSQFATPFTLSIGARVGIGTGISAPDRAHTIRTAANPHCKAEDLVRPGHVFPLIAHKEGLFGRHGHTEAATTLMMLSGFSPVAVICEILNQDGMPMRLPELKVFSQKHGLKIGAISELIAFTKK